MAIPGDRFYEEKRDQFGANSQPQRFQRDYISSVNYSIDELVAQLDIDSEPDYIDSISDDIDFDTFYRMALSMWVDHYLIRLGHRSGDLDLNKSFAAAERATKRLIQRRDQDAAYVAQATADADSATQNTIGMLED